MDGWERLGREQHLTKVDQEREREAKEVERVLEGSQARMDWREMGGEMCRALCVTEGGRKGSGEDKQMAR